MNLFGWDRVTIINTDTAYAKDMSTSFQRLWTGEVAYSATVKLMPNGDIDVPSVKKVLREAPLDDPINNSKVILLMGHSQHAFPILEIAKDYFPAETFWVAPDAWAGREPSSVDWMPRVAGYLGIGPFRNRDNVYRQFLQLGGDELARILNDEGNLPEYASETVDAIIAMAMALAATPVDRRDDGLSVAATLRKLDFAGVSGRIRFTIEGDRRDPQYSILNFQNNICVSDLWKPVTYTSTQSPSEATYTSTQSPSEAPYTSTQSPSEAPYTSRQSPSEAPISEAPINPAFCTSTRSGWVDVGSTGTTLGSARFGPKGIQGVCFAGVGCGLDSAPNDSPPVPKDTVAVWVPVVIGLLCSAFLLAFLLYRHKKIKASRKSKAILAAKESELNDFRNSVVDMCTAEEQYIPKLADMDNLNGIFPKSADTEIGNGIKQATTSARWSMSASAGIDNGNGTKQVSANTRWCWRESDGYMHKWDDTMIEGHPSECWVKYDDYSNKVLELAFQAQGTGGQCIPRPGYTIDFSTMSKTNDDTMFFVQTKDDTKFQREVKRIGPPKIKKRDDLSMIRVGKGRPKEIAKEPQMILVPGDIVQISKKRDDGWAYGSKLHQEDEPLGRRLVLLALSGKDYPSDDDVEDDDYVVTDNTGWFPINLTRVPNTDDLAILRKTLGQADDLSAPPNWDKIVDPSVVQKSAPLDKNGQEYQKVVDAFMLTLPPTMRIVSVQRIQNMGMWQSYIVKRKTVIDRDKSLQGGASGMKHALARFERSWLWHGTNVSSLYIFLHLGSRVSTCESHQFLMDHTQEDSVEKIIQQGFNRSFCGKNATFYGKGVYFARDASYSSCDTYSPPNSFGHKYILACSVVVGEFCRGKKDARTPDLRDAAKNILYDSTVDQPANPSLYVTYHDAQAYPEYVIIYKEKKRMSIRS